MSIKFTRREILKGMWADACSLALWWGELAERAEPNSPARQRARDHAEFFEARADALALAVAVLR